MMFFALRKMMLLVLLAMMRCLQITLGEAGIISETASFAVRQTSFKKRTFVGRQKCVFCWWREMDSNHRSETQQIYSLPPLATREPLHIQFRRIAATKLVYHHFGCLSILFLKKIIFFKKKGERRISFSFFVKIPSSFVGTSVLDRPSSRSVQRPDPTF